MVPSDDPELYSELAWRRRLEERIAQEAGGFTREQLQQIADGPIMDAANIYLPAGKLTQAEYAARRARILAGLPS